MKGIDEQLYHIPLVGWAVKRLYDYFGKHIALTDFFHVALGLGMGLMITGEKALGGALVTISILYHLYALMHG